MFAKRFWQTMPREFILNFMLWSENAVVGGISTFASIIKWQVDVTMGYNDNGTTRVSGNLSETGFHELSHASHYNKVGNNWWQNLVQAEIDESIANILERRFRPYGRGNTANSPIIALGESWAYHMGHFFTNLKYGGDSRDFTDQNITYRSIDLPYLNSNLNLLEGFSPFRTIDPFRWIPTGIYWDMMDNTNETAPIFDQVADYTNQQFFNSLDNDISTMQDFRNRLILENGNNQTTGVNTLFTSYNY